MTTDHQRNGALEAVERIVNRGGENEDVLDETLVVLRKLYPHAAIRLSDEIAELEVEGTTPDDAVFLNRVATLVSAYCRPRKMRSIFRG
ncbi:MAG: hypothetical protein ABI717_03295 [Actinomycetota bacterium]